MALLFFSPFAAQSQDEDSLRLWVEVPPAAPHFEKIVIRGDSVIFATVYPDSSAYVFNRRSRQFSRTVASGFENVPARARNIESGSVHIADSFFVATVEIPDIGESAVIRHSSGPIYGMRGERIAAERRWRTKRGLPPRPSPEPDNEDPRVPDPKDWARLYALSHAADSSAIWIGLHHGESDLEFALGGLMRFDRRTKKVSVVEDTMIIHTSVTQIEPVRDGVLLIADGSVLKYSTKTGSAVRVPLPAGAVEIREVNDSLFVAGREWITVLSLHDNQSVSKGFRITATNKGMAYELTDSTTLPPWDTVAAISAGKAIGIQRLDAWVQAAIGTLRPLELEYYYPGDRYHGTVPIEKSDSAEYEREGGEGPTAIIVSGFDHPRLRPFLRQSLLSRTSGRHNFVAEVLASVGDTAAVPFLRASIDSMPEGYVPNIVSALISLNDIDGVIDLLARPGMYSYVVLPLVRFTGAGVEAMHDSYGTSAQHEAARRWWREWYNRNRANLKPASKAAGDSAYDAMVEKLKKN